MLLHMPPLSALVKFENLDEFLSEFIDIGEISGGVGVFGSAAAYALVWEMGSSRAKKPGPKTVWGVNRDGDVRIFSSQAPAGYVNVLSNAFWPIVEEELSHMQFRRTDKRSVRLEFEVCIDNAMQRIARMISDAAPVDSGDLRSQIQYIDSEDSTDLMQRADVESEGTLVF